MEHDEIEMSDVMVVLEDCPAAKTDDLVAQLKVAGLAVGTTDTENHVVEGTLPSAKVKSLSALAVFVKYVRNVFTYVCDPTPEDHETEEDVDDMGR